MRRKEGKKIYYVRWEIDFTVNFLFASFLLLPMRNFRADVHNTGEKFIPFHPIEISFLSFLLFSSTLLLLLNHNNK